QHAVANLHSAHEIAGLIVAHPAPAGRLSRRPCQVLDRKTIGLGFHEPVVGFGWHAASWGSRGHKTLLAGHFRPAENGPRRSRRRPKFPWGGSPIPHARQY